MRRSDFHHAVEEIVQRRVAEVRQDELITTYQGLIDSVWSRLERTLGQVTISIMMDRALTETAEKYERLDCLEISKTGLFLEPLRQRVSLKSPAEAEEWLAEARKSLQELMVRLVDLLAVLTGDIVVASLLRELEDV